MKRIYKMGFQLLSQCKARFPVACIVETERGLYRGFDIEIGPREAWVCAERVAISSALLEDDFSFKKIYLFSKFPIYPCPLCWEWIASLFPGEGELHLLSPGSVFIQRIGGGKVVRGSLA